MTLLVNCQSICKTFGAQELFSDISITFSSDERLGLVGPNGSGKSTLLKIIAGLETVDRGEISIKKDTRLVYLPQTERFEAGKTIEQVLLDELAGQDVEDVEKYQRIKRWIARAGFEQSDQLVETLSGGWQKRLSIISSLCKEPDLLLLDEPTNHLDMEGILWLEELLQKPDFAFVLVTHDRYFLENVTHRTVELNSIFPQGYLRVDGCYSEFLLFREAALNNQLQLETVLANKVRRETEWLQRGPKARTSKARFRIEEAYRLKSEHSSVRQRNQQTAQVGIQFESSGRKTKKLVMAKQITKKMGEKYVINQLDVTLSPNQCLGLLGNNGSGKSTLIHILAGNLEPDQGSIQKVDDLKLVLFDQTREQLDQNESLRESLSPTGDSVVYRGRSVHVVSWAKKFLFHTDQLDMPVHRLSGGEQARILIARLMLQPADVLLLDEPTNDLDIPSLEVLEESIKEFPGAVVLVTHDRFLLDRVATSVIGLDGKGAAIHYADYNQWLNALQTKDKETKTTKSKARSAKPKTRKLSYNEQRELNQIEAKILKAEQAVEKFQNQLQEPETMNDPEKLQECCRLLQMSQEETEQLYARWDELESINAP